MRALEIMRRLNPNAIDAMENGSHIFVEDVCDSDGRWYRIEYRCAADGSNATSWLLYNPWGYNPFGYQESHLRTDGFICVGSGAHTERSPYGLDFVVKRSRFWCNGYSFLREHGYETTCRVLPDWGG